MHRTKQFINLSILEKNIELISILSGKKEIVAMVKSNAYGHGLIPIVKFLSKELGIKFFGVATIMEAYELRKELPNEFFEIFVFSDVQISSNQARELILGHRILPVIHNLKDLKFILESSDFKNLPLCLKFNTGMNRLGIDFNDCEKVINLLQKFKKMHIYHLMTHFANSSISVARQKLSRVQLERFQIIKKNFLDSKISIEQSSLANSGAIEQKFSMDESHIRPGLIMYGLSSMIKRDRKKSFWTGRCISKLEASILKYFSVKKGTPIGYGGVITPCDGYIVIISIGYGDGLPTHFEKVKIPFFGREAVFFGRVNMDMAQIFLKKELEKKELMNRHFMLWDHDSNSMLDLCDQSEIIPYELLCKITSRVPKHYVLK